MNVTQDMSDATLEVVLRALFGESLERLERSHGSNPFALLTDHTARNLAFAYKFRQLGKLIMEDVAQRRRDGERGNDIVSHLIDARDRASGEPMSDRELLDEIMTLIVAGHETTAASLNWFWLLLAQAPEVAQRLHAEVGIGGDAPDYDDLARFPYTRRALDETLRLYPPGWLLTRRSIAASQLGDFELPAGTDVLVSPYLVQRHPGFWPDPDAFDPDRFLPEAVAARDRFVYLPFGLGPTRVHRRAPGRDRDARACDHARPALRPHAGARPDGGDRAAGQPAHARAGFHERGIARTIAPRRSKVRALLLESDARLRHTDPRPRPSCRQRPGGPLHRRRGQRAHACPTPTCARARWGCSITCSGRARAPARIR